MCNTQGSAHIPNTTYLTKRIRLGLANHETANVDACPIFDTEKVCSYATCGDLTFVPAHLGNFTLLARTHLQTK